MRNPLSETAMYKLSTISQRPHPPILLLPSWPLLLCCRRGLGGRRGGGRQQGGAGRAGRVVQKESQPAEENHNELRGPGAS